MMQTVVLLASLTAAAGMVSACAQQAVEQPDPIAMLEDPEWPLDGQERVDVISALAYFHNPADLISDDVPVIGLIDDAIMIELVARELDCQLDAYDEFCEYRSSEEGLRGADVSREEWLHAKQTELMKRMRERLGRINRNQRGSSRLTRFSFLR